MPEAATQAAAEASPKKSRRKLIIIVAAVGFLAGGGGGAFFYMKQQAAAAAAAAAAEEDGGEAPSARAHRDTKTRPTYVPLEAFVVNLADKESDRFAQIGITLQVDDTKVAEDMKTYMPAIRNGILMILAHKSSEELLERGGKELLAKEVMQAAARALGIDVEPTSEEPAKDKHAKPAKRDKTASDDEGEEGQLQKAKKKKKVVHNPIANVLFSNFIIQ